MWENTNFILQVKRISFKILITTEMTFWYRVSHETWQLLNSLECRLPNTGLDLKTFCSYKNLLLPIYFKMQYSVKFAKNFIEKQFKNSTHNILILCGIEKMVWIVLFLRVIQYLEDDILNYSSTVMFRGTPCTR